MFDNPNKWVGIAEGVWSGYKPANYGWTLYSLVRSQRPNKAVEIGVLNGYSTMFISAALRDNGNGIILQAWDLFEHYEYNHAKMDDTQKSIDLAGLDGHVRLIRESMWFAYDYYANNSTNWIDFLHVDISNDGDVYQFVIDNFGPLMSPHGIIVMEGGTIERDRTDWMIKYDKSPIYPFLQSLDHTWKFFSFLPYPGLTILRKDHYGSDNELNMGEIRVC